MLEQGIRAPGESDRDFEPLKVFQALRKNFINAENAARAKRAILSNGFPANIAGWIFATFTIDRSRYPDPEKAHATAIKRLRNVFCQIRKAGLTIRRYCRKTEFHCEDEQGRGYTHYHYLIDCPEDGSRLKNSLEKSWQMGGCSVEYVQPDESDNKLGYMTKAVDHIPKWVDDKESTIRLWQTSRGFYDVDKPSSQTRSRFVRRRLKSSRKSKRATKRERLTFGQRIERNKRTIVLRTPREDGSYGYRTIVLSFPWWDFVCLVHKNMERKHPDCDGVNISSNAIYVPTFEQLERLASVKSPNT